MDLDWFHTLFMVSAAVDSIYILIESTIADRMIIPPPCISGFYGLLVPMEHPYDHVRGSF